MSASICATPDGGNSSDDVCIVRAGVLQQADIVVLQSVFKRFTAADDALDEPEGDFVVAQAGGSERQMKCWILFQNSQGAK